MFHFRTHERFSMEISGGDLVFTVISKVKSVHICAIVYCHKFQT